MAAAAAIIATLAFGIRYFVENEIVKPEVAITDQTESSGELQDFDSAKAPVATLSEDSNQILAFEDREANRSISRERIAAPKASTAENTRVEPLADTNFAIPETDASSIAAEEKEIAAAPIMERTKTDDATQQLQKPSAARSITSNTIFLPERMIIGKLTNASGEPLIGATVAANGTDRGTTTGLNGDFTLPVTPDMKELTFSYTGFETTAISIGKNDTVRVQLKENQVALSEIVGSDYATKNREAKKWIVNCKGRCRVFRQHNCLHHAAVLTN